jgi:hypothetical protein
MFAETVGQFFRPRQKPEVARQDIRVGGIYRHSGPGNVVETAKVIDVAPDAMGIPHVRFEVQVEQSRVRQTRFAATRTLNLETFADYFFEPIKA